MFNIYFQRLAIINELVLKRVYPISPHWTPLMINIIKLNLKKVSYLVWNNAQERHNYKETKGIPIETEQLEFFLFKLKIL